MAGDKHRLAVLPLVNISPDPGDEYFADGMTEELISALSNVGGLSVIARTSAMKYKGATKSVAEIGRDLNIKTLLEGSVRKAGNKVRITVQLIDAQSEEHLWAQAYDRDLEDIFAIQSDIAQRVARSLRVQIVRREKRAIEQRATDVVEAYTLYLKGRHEWNKRSPEGLDLAVHHFGQALEKDASYALAYSGLADAYALQALYEFAPPREVFPKAKAAAERALQLKTGARGLRTIIEEVLLEVMYEIPSRADVRKCIIGRETIAHGQAPLLVTTRSGAIAELEEASEYRDAS